MSLKEAFKSSFTIGTSVSKWNMESDEAKRELVKHYNTMTCENEMKPMFFFDQEANLENPEKYNTEPALCFDRARKYLEFCRDNGIALRGHTLVWHGQTPFWFFKEKYSMEKEAPLADRETMLKRMESYISRVLNFVQTEYPGVVYAWDVVNEAVEETEENGWRQWSLWMKTVGEDFVLHAFRIAREYAAEGVKLFYNDYNTFLPKKREYIYNLILKPLMEEKLIDGIGMQSHLVMNESSLKDYEESLRFFGGLGLEVHATELDIHNTDNSEEGLKKLADTYGELFRILLKAKREGAANLTNVTIWGMRDCESWLTGFKKEKSYPLLFDDNYGYKEAYYAVVKTAEE